MIIYKTTNKINGKFYIGKDENNNPEYYGSGLLLIRSIKKYGKENFFKEILEFCSSKAELNEREKYWISKFNATIDGYNIALGGSGGDTYTNNPKLAEIKKKFIGNKNHFYNRKHSDETKQKISKSQLGRKAWNKGKKNIYTKEHLENLSNIRKNKYAGENHPNFKEIDKEELTNFLKNNSLRKTAKHFNVSVGCIQNKIKLFNINKKGGQ